MEFSGQFKVIVIVVVVEEEAERSCMTLTKYIANIQPELKEEFFSDLLNDNEIGEVFKNYCGEVLGILDSKYFNTLVTTSAENLKNIMLRSFIEGYMAKSYQVNYFLENTLDK